MDGIIVSLLADCAPFARIAARKLRRAALYAGIETADLESVALAGLWLWLERRGYRVLPDAALLKRVATIACIDWLRRYGPVKRTDTRRYDARQLSQLEREKLARAQEVTRYTEGAFERVDLADECEHRLRRLPQQHRQACRLYYLDNLTMREVGKQIGVCESRVSQIISEARKIACGERV